MAENQKTGEEKKVRGEKERERFSLHKFQHRVCIIVFQRALRDNAQPIDLIEA